MLISVLGVLACLQHILSLTRFTTAKYDIAVVLLCAQTLNETQQRIAVNIHAIFKTLYMYIGCRHFSFSLFPLVKMHDSMLLSVPQAFAKLSLLAEQRGDAYANADVRVSLEEIAAKQGHGDVSQLTPTDIAIEALQKIQNFVNEHSMASGPFEDL
jgi:hypothetical protein